MTHNEITIKAAKWLKRHPDNIAIPNCSVVAHELVAATPTGEIPDVIGWCSWASVLIEVKTSKADYHKDSNKPFRSDLQMGMGEFKYYLCPIDLITAEELPEYWGLLHINKSGQISIIKKATQHQCNLRSERAALLSLQNKKPKSKQP